MENNEVMSKELDEVLFVAEEIVPKSGKGLKIVGGITGGLALGYGLYKGAKWVAGKIRAKKEEKTIVVAQESAEECDDE